jgi:DNA-binding HxlR family transcriptional regulator
VGDKWTLLIVRDLAGGPRRFVELQRTLPGISTEQLRSRLNRMVADGLLTRQRYREVPPRVDYELTERSRALLPVIGELARWGYRWAWGPPREGEDVDVGAILRASTGLRVPTETAGTYEVCVESRERGARRYTLIARDGVLEYSEREPRATDARIRGSELAFVEAFSQNGTPPGTGLELEGDERLARALIDALRSHARSGEHVA